MVNNNNSRTSKFCKSLLIEMDSLFLKLSKNEGPWNHNFEEIIN